MGKTRDLFKKFRDTKGTFHAKMGSIKDRNGMGLTEAEILRRGGKNTSSVTELTLYRRADREMVYLCRRQGRDPPGEECGCPE